MRELSGAQRKQMGLDLVTQASPDFLTEARAEARRLCEVHGHVCTDDLRRWAKAHGIEPHHPNAWGAVFRGSEWEAVGYRNSDWPSAHNRLVRVWRLRSSEEG